MSRKNFGRAGHLIVGDRCRFHLHTHVGKFCVSTVGEYYVTDNDTKPTTVGYNRLYETMVFNMRAKATRWREIDASGYNKERDAEAGHERLVKKYEAL